MLYQVRLITYKSYTGIGHRASGMMGQKYYNYSTGHDIKRDRQLAKFWINPVSLEKNSGFKEHKLNQRAHLVEEYEETLLEAWDDYFDP
jgi:hypothetical protein